MQQCSNGWQLVANTAYDLKKHFPEIWTREIWRHVLPGRATGTLDGFNGSPIPKQRERSERHKRRVWSEWVLDMHRLVAMLGGCRYCPDTGGRTRRRRSQGDPVRLPRPPPTVNRRWPDYGQRLLPGGMRTLRDDDGPD